MNVVVAVLLANLKVGLLAFGGGNAAIPLLQAEAVPRWLSAEEFAELVGLNFALPGVTIVKIAALVGLRAAGPFGLLAAVFGIVTPGLALTAAVATLVARHRDQRLVQRALLALQLGAVALLASGTLKLVPRWPGMTAVLFIVGLFAVVHFTVVPPALALLGTVLLGLFLL